MLLREGEEKFPAVCTASPFTAANKRVREPWRHAPLRAGFLPRSYFGGKTLTICSSRSRVSERASGQFAGEQRGNTGDPPLELPPSPKIGPTRQLGACLFIKDVMLMREERREVPGAGGRRRWGCSAAPKFGPIEREGGSGGGCWEPGPGASEAG